ncbi:hypothetical protein ACLVWU_04630 [Bdellovibrio sp. HCB290]|uniref:hypothetical protein n=1 Tax=Bdellovibrio sp. HCB290 TaxID=3394356 RepID=UPI0039B6672C
MWIILKVLFSSAAYLLRYTYRYMGIHRLISSPSYYEGVEIFSYLGKGRGKQQLTTWNRTFNCKTSFKLTRESSLDKFFKNWGFAEEIQTNDLTFDSTIYIASDSTGFMRKIQTDSQCRNLIQQLFENGCLWISGGGNAMQARFEGDRRDDQSIAGLFAQLTKHIEELQKLPREMDHFAAKALITESIIWGFAAYAIVSTLQWLQLREDIYINGVELAKSGLLVSSLIAFVFIVVIGLIFRKSSRGHRIIIESFLVLAFAIPFGGIALFSDVNIQMDRSPSTIIEGTVEGHYTQMHRRRAGRHYITYHIQVVSKSPNSILMLPTDLRISSRLYEELNMKSRVRIEIGAGKLKHPWIRRITAL